jgi:hypothetical protein
VEINARRRLIPVATPAGGRDRLSLVSTGQVHSKLLTIAATEELGDLEMRRKGRSRKWPDDHGWWLGVVEFQPSSYSRGTYLNVGVHWLWTAGAHLRFGVEGGSISPRGSTTGSGSLSSRKSSSPLSLVDWRRRLRTESQRFARSSRTSPWPLPRSAAGAPPFSRLSTLRSPMA